MNTRLYCLVIIILSNSFFLSAQKDTSYKNNWTSLRKHHTPQWLIESKFGIYCHWGIATIKYIDGNENLTNDEVISKFTAKNFDADKIQEQNLEVLLVGTEVIIYIGIVTILITILIN